MENDKERFYVIVRSFNVLESLIADVLSSYLSNSNRKGLFKKEILENFTFDHKYRLLKKLNNIEPIFVKTKIDNISKLQRIRNCLVHQPQKHDDKFDLDLDGQNGLMVLYSAIFLLLSFHFPVWPSPL